MLVAHAEGLADRLPTECESENADQLCKIITDLVGEGEPANIRLTSKKGQVADVVLDPAVAYALLDVLRLVASGKGVRLIPVNADLTSQQAADLLNVPRPFLIKLLDEGLLPFSRVGRHRRIKAEDLFACKKKRDARRATLLSEMAAKDAEMGLV